MNKLFKVDISLGDVNRIIDILQGDQFKGDNQVGQILWSIKPQRDDFQKSLDDFDKNN